MKQYSVLYVDPKGEAGHMSFKTDDSVSLDETGLKAFLDGKSNVSFTGFNETIENNFVTPTVAGAVGIFGDKDLKANLVFDWPERNVSLRVSIPAPVINIDAGIVVRWGQDKAFVPPVKLSNEVGKSGGTIASELSTLLTGESDKIIFKSGGLSKR